MNIPAKIYENLSPAERIRAAVSALARNDDAELQTLKVTCPKQAYLMTDPAYAERMTQLFSVMLCMEYRLSYLALEFQMANQRMGHAWCEIQQMVLAQTDSIVTAWNQLIGEMEIDPAEMAKTGPPRHPFVTATIQIAQGEADPESVETDLQDMRDLLAVT